jgi:hypothetical protein
MRNSIKWILVVLVLAASAWGIAIGRDARQTADREHAADLGGRLLRATYSPLHFKPAIETATDAQCLACHKEVLEDKAACRFAGRRQAADSTAWYQRDQHVWRRAGHLPSAAHGDSARAGS